MSDEERAVGLPGADVGVELIKELTLSNIELAKSLRGLTVTIVGTASDQENPEGLAGLMEQISALGEAVSSLEERVIGFSLKGSIIEFVLDRLADIAQGNPEADPPIAARTVTWEDAANAKREYDAKLEEEAMRDAEAAAAEDAADAAAAAAEEEPAPPLKPPMIGNVPPAPKVAPMPGMTAPPPLPVAAPKPQ